MTGVCERRCAQACLCACGGRMRGDVYVEVSEHEGEGPRQCMIIYMLSMLSIACLSLWLKQSAKYI